jgi:hypothetical protein
MVTKISSQESKEHKNLNTSITSISRTEIHNSTSQPAAFKYTKFKRVIIKSHARLGCEYYLRGE